MRWSSKCFASFIFHSLKLKYERIHLKEEQKNLDWGIKEEVEQRGKGGRR